MSPNLALQQVIQLSGASHAALAHRINQLAHATGFPSQYTHTSIANWTRRGVVPRPHVARLLAQALSERLARPVSVFEIGLAEGATTDHEAGLGFARCLDAAVDSASRYWSSSAMDRRSFLHFAFSAAALRWAVQPADAHVARDGGKRIGHKDLRELADIAEQARYTDSRYGVYGGGSLGARTVQTCLREVCAPMLQGSYSDTVGRNLFTTTAILGRLAGWVAFDSGAHSAAQRHFIQALRMARAAGDLPLGGYVLACMALQATLRGFHELALDMLDVAAATTRQSAPPGYAHLSG